MEHALRERLAGGCVVRRSRWYALRGHEEWRTTWHNGVRAAEPNQNRTFHPGHAQQASTPDRRRQTSAHLAPTGINPGNHGKVEQHILRARPDGGVRNKAACRELKRAMPVGLV